MSFSCSFFLVFFSVLMALSGIHWTKLPKERAVWPGLSRVCLVTPATELFCCLFHRHLYMHACLCACTHTHTHTHTDHMQTYFHGCMHTHVHTHITCTLTHPGASLYGVHRTWVEMAAISHGTSHVATKWCCKYTTSMDIPKCAVKGCSHSFRNTCDKSAVSLLESRVSKLVFYSQSTITVS